jgi:hypothetical protein
MRGGEGRRMYGLYPRHWGYRVIRRGSAEVVEGSPTSLARKRHGSSLLYARWEEVVEADKVGSMCKRDKHTRRLTRRPQTSVPQN